MSEQRGTIRLPARDIVVPSTVSREARAVMASPPAERAESPALDDQEAWRAMIAAHDCAIAAMMAAGTAVRMGARVWAVDYRMPPITPSRRRLTTAWRRTGRCWPSGRRSGSWSGVPRRAATSPRR